ncbi:MAG: hypothetical protein RL768_430 [Nitrospirota bacterium]|jgi:hypothetical protein
MKRKRKIQCYAFNKNRFTKYSIGGLWTNEKKMNPEHPDLMGELDVPKILVDDLVQQYEAKGSAKISLAAWKNVSKDGEAYLTMTGKLPKAIEKTIVTK